MILCFRAGVWPRANASRFSWPFALCFFTVLLLGSAPVGSISFAQADASNETSANSPGDPAAENPSAISDSLAFELLRMLAREDTLGLLEIDYILGEFIEAEDERPTLQEIIGWCIESEENRFEDLGDAQFRRRYRVIEFYGDPEDPGGRRVLTEEVEQVYIKPPDQILKIRLGERTWDSDEAETDEELETEIEMLQNDIGRLPVFFQELDAYDFSILERRLFPTSILYKIAFKPRSAFDALPSGWFLVDTAGYHILRAEYSLTQNLPYPLFLKAIDKVQIQKREVKGFWFVESVQVAVTMKRLPLPIPKRIELDIQIEDLRVNEGIADSVWAAR